MEQRRKKPGLGYVRPDGKGARRIFVSFDEETFAEVHAYALAHGLSFTGAVRHLVEFGLIDVAAA